MTTTAEKQKKTGVQNNKMTTLKTLKTTTTITTTTTYKRKPVRTFRKKNPIKK